MSAKPVERPIPTQLRAIVAALRDSIQSPTISEDVRVVLVSYGAKPDSYSTVKLETVSDVLDYARSRSDELRRSRFATAERGELPTDNVEVLEEIRWYNIISQASDISAVIPGIVKDGVHVYVPREEAAAQIVWLAELLATFSGEMDRLGLAENENPDICVHCEDGQALYPGGICKKCQQDILDSGAPEGYEIVGVAPTDHWKIYERIQAKTGLDLRFTDAAIDLHHGSAKAALNCIKLLVATAHRRSYDSFIEILHRMADVRGQTWPNVTDDVISSAYIEWPGIRPA